MADLLVESLHFPFIGHFDLVALVVRRESSGETIQGLLLPSKNLAMMHAMFCCQLAQRLFLFQQFQDDLDFLLGGVVFSGGGSLCA